MSSDGSNSVVYDGRLLLHLAENGRSFELICDEATMVDVVMQYVESVSGTDFVDQLILCSDVRLEPNHPLSAYKLPSKDREVFIFSRSRLQNNSPLPPLEQDVELVDLPEPKLARDPHPLDEVTDPALKALPSYERQFRYHFEKGQVTHSKSQVNYDKCERLLREMGVQERAIEVARCNLEQCFRIIEQNYNEFMKQYNHKHEIHSKLLANLKRYFDKLKSIELHPSLKTDTLNSLADFVKVDVLRKALDNCGNSHKQFEKKVMEFKQSFCEAKLKVEEFFACMAPFCSNDLEIVIHEHRRIINEQNSILQSLGKDVNTVKKLVDDCLTCQSPSSLRPHDAVSALGPMYDVHEKSHLPKLHSSDRAISKLLECCLEKKNEMNKFIHFYMQKVAYVSFVIKDAKLQFPAFREALAHQDGLFMDLKLVHGIGPAYRACLAEVIRRKASMKLYMGMAGHLAEKLARRREDEIRRREEFMRAYCSYIPRDVLTLMGLYDMPNQCDVNITPFDTNLLDIDISDLNRYAPECLLDFFLKPSNNSSICSIEAEGTVVEGVRKVEDTFFLEDFELTETAGTSKMEVENARLKADLASAIALLCSVCPESRYEAMDDSKFDVFLKDVTEKTEEALQLKDEYKNKLELVLKEKQTLCFAYEKRIRELENKLSDWLLQMQRSTSGKDSSSSSRLGGSQFRKQEVSCYGGSKDPCSVTSKRMDEFSCISSSLEAKLGIVTEKASKKIQGTDDHMLDSSELLTTQIDSSMLESHCEDFGFEDTEAADRAVIQPCMSLTCNYTAESVTCDTVVASKFQGDIVSELQNQLREKENELNESEIKCKSVADEVSFLTRELESNRTLLHESQMNCAHLENCLHEAREESQTHLCASDRRAAEYNALRASAVKICALFERLRSSVCSGGVADFADSLQALALSLANSGDENGGSYGLPDFCNCIRVLSEKVGLLSKHREELLDKLSKLESEKQQLKKEKDEKVELAASLFKKLQMEKQATKEKISLNHLQVHEIAAFVRNSSGHYVAISREFPMYFLSPESVALFTDHQPQNPIFIVGQVVHIERKIARSVSSSLGRGTDIDLIITENIGRSLNPYNLPIGREYFVVTVAMLPDVALGPTLA